jgi:hypothetical protein
VHEVALKVPSDAAWPENDTVPVGVSTVPLPSVSVTVAVQVVGEPEPTEEGEHETLVAALRRYACPWKGINSV